MGVQNLDEQAGQWYVKLETLHNRRQGLSVQLNYYDYLKKYLASTA